MEELYIPLLEDLSAISQQLLELIGNQRKIAFYGEVGAGKTTLIKEICRNLGVQENVASPTFSIVNEYSRLLPETNQESAVYHIDLYRLKTIDEAIEIGIEEYLYDKNYCFIEWPDLIAPLLPENCVKIRLEITADSLRKIVFL